MKNSEEMNPAPKAKKTTWKKVFIVALCLIGAAALIFVGLLCQVYYDKYHKITYRENWTTSVSTNIIMSHGRIGMTNFVQLKDIRIGEFTTPRLQHVFTNEYNSEDSLVVFRTHDRLRGYLNINTGKIVIPAQYNRAWNFNEGIAAVYNDGIVSFINENGEPAFPKTFPIRYNDEYSEITFQFHNGLCIMRTVNNKWGLINTQGDWVVEPIYHSIDAPYHGYRCMYNGSKFGMLGKDGSVALPPEYDDIRRSSDGKGWILVKDGLAKEVDFQFNVLIPFVHDGLHMLSYIDEYRDGEDDEYETASQQVPEPRFFRFDVGRYSGVIDSKGRVVIPAIYHNVRIVNDNLFEVEISYNGERVLYDTKGHPIGNSGI